VISGSIHLSSDLRRLAYVRLFVWLTSPRTRIRKETLIKKYREVIEKHRDKYHWNVEPTKKIRMSGMGMGSSKRPPERDVIALNHLTLSQDLGFLRKGETRWGKNGYILASLFVDEKGIPFFYNPDKFEKELRKEGFIATLGAGEKLIFSIALMQVDVDRIFPLLSMFEDEVTTGEVEHQFLNYVNMWLAKKSELEPNISKRIKIGHEQRDIKHKISRLELEKKQSRITSRARKKSSVRLYCHEQTSPRLHFLQDLGYIEKDNGIYRLTELGTSIKKVLIDPFFKKDNINEINTLPLRNEVKLMEIIVNTLTRSLPTLEFERFNDLFLNVVKFYTRSGAILLNYFNTFEACASNAFELSTSLSLEAFDHYMSRLSESKKIIVSTSGRGTKYIKVYRKLISP